MGKERPDARPWYGNRESKLATIARASWLMTECTGLVSHPRKRQPSEQAQEGPTGQRDHLGGQMKLAVVGI